MPEKVRVGVIGCGAISGAYFSMAKNFPILEMAACADLDESKAKAAAAQFSVPKAMAVDQLLADRSIDIVLNLTIPQAHVPVSLAALEAGKHVYLEKPLGIDRQEGKKVIDLAKAKNLRVGCAPDTFMGAAIQTARKLIDDGAIGKPVAFTAFMMGRGHEHWHANPRFFYEKGGGPMFDMGPYYLTALLNLLGPVRRISGMTSIAIAERIITSQPRFGEKISVQTPDHVTGLMEFEGGAVGAIVQSFAMRAAEYNGAHPIAIFGTKGSIKVPDPNHFDGKVLLCAFGEAGQSDQYVEAPSGFTKGYGRAVGLADMAMAIRTGRPHRASGDQGFAVLDLMQGFLDSSASGREYIPSTRYERAAPMREGLPPGELDA